MSEKMKTILITTKYYPTAGSESDGWGDIKLQNPAMPDGNTLNLKKPVFLDFINIDTRQKYENSPSVKFHIIDKQYKICVAPCMAPTSREEERYTYLNAIVQSVKDNEQNWYDNFFLVSHDKDFGKKVDNCLVETTYIQKLKGDYFYLKKLIVNHHAYLFQHGDESEKKKLADFINAQKLNDPQKITIEDCNTLWNKISSPILLYLGNALNFFCDCNNDEQNCYPEIEKNCYPR